jgi:pilus assembly protein FimV
MVRKSSVHILLISFLLILPGQLLSLGLGEIEVDSALNQPLNAQIGLISARADELEEMRVELAPANVFDRVGVPRPYFLTQLKFTPVSLPGGGTAIRVTSKDPVREPFLTFLVEVTWPKGRLLREYTVLLDPPEFAQQRAPQIATPVTTPVIQDQVVEAEPVEVPQVVTPTEVVTAEQTTDVEAVREQLDRELGLNGSASEATTEIVDDVVETVATPIAEEPVVNEPAADVIEDAVVESVVESTRVYDVADDVIIPEDIPGNEGVISSGGEAVVSSDVVDADVIEAEVIAESEVYTESSVTAGEHVVVGGDTLFKIAKNAKPSSAVSINQMMVAIQQANPDAFARNNINLLKKGAVLRIPDVGEAQSASSAEARNLISQQNALWREYRNNTSQVAAKNVDAPELVEEKNTVVSEAKQALKETVKETVKKAETVKQDLNILAAEDGKQADSSMQIAGGEELKKLQNEVTLTKELAESKGKEAEELKSRVEALESMLEKKEKILTIQNQQLKDLQQQLSTEEDKAATAEKMLKEKAAQEEVKPEVKSEVKPQAKPIEKKIVEEVKKPLVEPLPEFADPVVAEQPMAKPRLEPLPDWDSLPEIEPIKEEVVAEVTPTEKPTEVKPEEVKPEQVKPVQTPAEINQAETVAGSDTASGVMGFATSLYERFKSVLLPLVGGLLLLLGGLWFWRKKSVKTVELSGLGEMPMELGEDDDHFDDILDETIVTPQTNVAEEVDDVGTIDDLGLDDEDMGFTPNAAETSGDAELGEDVFDEADVYISYGLHQQAQDLLTDAIAKDPNNSDYKAKLAEVYYSQKDSQAFEQYAEKVKDEVGESSEQWQNILAMGKEIAPSSALFAGAAALGVAAKAAIDKPGEADVDIGLQTVIDNPLSDANLEDTFLDNDAGTDDDDGLDFNIDDPLAEGDLEDDPVASKIMEANETSDILNFEVDDLSDDILEDDAEEDDADADTVMDAMATGLHETASMDDLTQELEQIGMQTTMNDLKPLDLDEGEIDIAAATDDTVAMQSDDFDIDTALTPADPDETAAYKPSSLDGNFGGDDTEQFDVTNMDTEFLDPAEQTVAQTHTDLQELGPPSLIEEVGTKLDLAKAFVDMGDSDAAKETLLEVINEGDESQIKAAKDLMDKLGS